MSQQPQPPAGWYADPSGAPQRRYWDGNAWTDHLAAPAAAPASASLPALDREADLEQLRADGRRAKIAVAVGVPFYAVSPALQGQQIRQSRKAISDLRTQLDQLEPQSPGTPGVRVEPYTAAPVSTFGSALSLPTLVIGVLFLIWFHRAVSIAARAGRRARRSPGWAVGGWFIPIGNFFLPYQSAKDIFTPQDEAGRRVTKHWWAVYLGAAAINIPLGVLAGFNDDVAVAIAVGALALVVWLYAALRAHAFIDAANASLADPR